MPEITPGTGTLTLTGSTPIRHVLVSGATTSVVQILIAGIDKTQNISDLRYNDGVNTAGQASFTVEDLAGVYIPPDDASVEVYIGGVRDWYGEISGKTIEFLGWNTGVVTRVTAAERSQIASRRIVNRTIAAGSLYSLLSGLVTGNGELVSYGVTLHASQPNPGPTLEAVVCEYWPVDKLLSHVGTLLGQVWTIDKDNVLRMWTPGDLVSGVTLSLSSVDVQEATWQQHRFEYRNRQYLKFPCNGQAWQDWNPVTDHQTSFSISYSEVILVYYVRVWHNEVLTDYPCGLAGEDTAFTYDGSGTINYDKLKPNGPEIDFHAANDTFAALLLVVETQTVMVEDAAEIALHGIWERVDETADKKTWETATTFAQALMDKSKVRPKIPNIITRTNVLPGYTVSVSLSVISLVATCLVQTREVELRESDSGVVCFYTLTMASDGENPSTRKDIWLQLLGQGLTGTSSVGSVSGGTPTGGGSGTSIMHAHLGGSRTELMNYASYTPVINYQIFRCPTTGNYSFRTEVQTQNAGTTVYTRLWDLSATPPAIVAGSETSSTATSWEENSVLVALIAGHRYRADFRGSNTTYNVQCGQATVEL